MTEHLIKLENVWKIYQLGELSLEVLREVNLEIKLGDFMTIMGSSGSGKSTLLHIIGCLDAPTKGRMLWRGKDTSKFSEDNLAKIRGRNIGFVFQQFNLLPNLSAFENVALPMIFQGVGENERKEKSKKLLSSLGLGSRMFHRPAELSGGEQQRVAIARSLANDPDIIVADEPTGNLDSSTGKMIMETLVNLHKNNKKTIVVVTHDPNIANYSEQVVNIKDGQIISNHLQSKKNLWST